MLACTDMRYIYMSKVFVCSIFTIFINTVESLMKSGMVGLKSISDESESLVYSNHKSF